MISEIIWNCSRAGSEPVSELFWNCFGTVLETKSSKNEFPKMNFPISKRIPSPQKAKLGMICPMNRCFMLFYRRAIKKAQNPNKKTRKTQKCLDPPHFPQFNYSIFVVVVPTFVPVFAFLVNINIWLSIPSDTDQLCLR
jgi:hypothetical protein